jgi:hypothetical protein
MRQERRCELDFDGEWSLSGLRQMSRIKGTSICRKSNWSRTIAAGSTNPSASAAPGRRIPPARPSDQCDKAIAAPDDRGDVPVAALAIRQGTTQRGNTYFEIAFSNEGLGPDFRNQLRLADDFAGAFHKSDQQIEDATADRDGLAAFQQKSPCPKQPEGTKGNFDLGRVILAINCLDRQSRVGARRRWVQTV